MPDTTGLRGEQIEGKFETTINTDGQATLDVAIHAGLIRVRIGEPGVVQIRGVMRGRRSLFGWGSAEERIRQLEANPPIQQDGSTIHIGDVADRWLLRGVALFLEINAPADVRIRALSDSGDIRIEEAGSSVDCESDAGDVDLTAVDAPMRISTDSGGIRIRQSKGRIYASSDSGDIDCIDVDADIEASTDSGEIRIVQAVAEPVRAESDSGSILVQLAPEAGFNISTTTDHGEILVPELEWREPRSRQEMNGNLRGGGPVIDLTTDSGDIAVR